MIPESIAELLDALEMFPDRHDRIQALISVSERFKTDPAILSARPHDERHRVPGCESEVFVFVSPGNQFDFDVQNPQGLSAMAWAQLLKEGLNGLTKERIQSVPEDLVYQVFGNELSMGKSMGLTNMLRMCKALAA